MFNEDFKQYKGHIVRVICNDGREYVVTSKRGTAEEKVNRSPLAGEEEGTTE